MPSAFASGVTARTSRLSPDGGYPLPCSFIHFTQQYSADKNHHKGCVRTFLPLYSACNIWSGDHLIRLILYHKNEGNAKVLKFKVFGCTYDLDRTGGAIELFFRKYI